MQNIGCIYLLIINLIGFLSMYFDKQKAIHNKWRIEENTLFFIALLGGGVGSYFGMKKFRHKTKHKKFKILIPIIAVIQIFMYVYIKIV